MPPPVELLPVAAAVSVLPIAAPDSSQATHADSHGAPRREPTPSKEIHREQIRVDEKVLALGFSVDHSNNVIKIRVTNQNSGELVREFELKGLGEVHHEPLTQKGVMVDDQG